MIRIEQLIEDQHAVGGFVDRAVACSMYVTSTLLGHSKGR